MVFEEIISNIDLEKTFVVDDKDFKIEMIETILLASGDKLVWLWAEDGTWLVVDVGAEEIMVFFSVEEEVDADEEFAFYRGTSHEQIYADEGRIEKIVGEAIEHEEGIKVEFRHFETDSGECVRSIERVGASEEMWYFGRALSEDDIRMVV